MKGASGATLNQFGDLVRKSCNDALEQVQWFREAKYYETVDGIRIIDVYEHGLRWYTMQHISGHIATHEPQTVFIERMYEQINHWRTIYPTTNGTWSSYINRLYEHAETTKSHLLHIAVEMVEAYEPFEQSFCHGDLTLENILIDHNGDAWLIDPNRKDDLFQSWILDCGKLLQSTHTQYHRLFNSHAGLQLRKHDAVLCELLRADKVYEQALVGCLTHIIRLCKYRQNEIDKVELLAFTLMKELQWTF